MESMNRRLGSILESQKKLEEKKRNASARKRQVAKWTLKTGETK